MPFRGNSSRSILSLNIRIFGNFCSKDLSKLPSIYVRPVVLKDATGEKRESNYYYECPVFMNKARQVCPATLPLSSGISPDNWIMAGTAIILDPGTISY